MWKTPQFNVGDLVAFYKEAKARFDEDAAFKEIARAEVYLFLSAASRGDAVWCTLEL